VPIPSRIKAASANWRGTSVSLFPAGTTRLVEPFAGSAAVSLAAGHMKRIKRWAINDLHRPLIELWTEIVRNPDEISTGTRRSGKRQLGDERAHYDRVRERFNAHHRPEDFLYLLAPLREGRDPLPTPAASSITAPTTGGSVQTPQQCDGTSPAHQRCSRASALFQPWTTARYWLRRRRATLSTWTRRTKA